DHLNVPTSLLVDDAVLLDCGVGVVGVVGRAAGSLARVREIIFSGHGPAQRDPSLPALLESARLRSVGLWNGLDLDTLSTHTSETGLRFVPLDAERGRLAWLV